MKVKWHISSALVLITMMVLATLVVMDGAYGYAHQPPCYDKFGNERTPWYCEEKEDE